MTSNLIAAVSDLIAEVAETAILPRFKRLKTGEIEEKTPGELVTIVDREAEAMLATRLAEFMPGARIVGEEGAAAGPTLLAQLDDGPVWLIDPLDGTSNFVDGRVPFATMVALLVVVPNLTRGGAPYGLIENVVSDAAHRKKGFGRAVLKAAIASAWQQCCCKVMLLTGSTNPATLKFYRDVGFEQNKTGFHIRQIAVRPE